MNLEKTSDGKLHLILGVSILAITLYNVLKPVPKCHDYQLLSQTLSNCSSEFLRMR